MNLRTFALPLLLLGGLALAQQGPVKFQRAYKEGESDVYRTTVVASTTGGTLEMTAEVKQTVMKLYENGEVDVETDIGRPQMAFNGQIIPPELIADRVAPEIVTTRLDKSGTPISGESKSSFSKLVLSMFLYSAFVSENDLRIGEAIKIDRTYGEGDRKQHTTGTSSLEEIKDGMGKLHTKLSIASAGQAEPTKVDVTSYIELSTAKPKKVSGTITGLPENNGLRTESVDFKIERAP